MVNYKLKYILLFFLFGLAACDSRKKLEDIFNKSFSGTQDEQSTQVTYQISAPDGNTYRIKGPKGASQEEVVAAIISQNPNSAKTPMQQQEERARLDVRTRRMENQDGPIPLILNGNPILCQKIGVVIDCN